jgi:hypothetical protein
MTTESDDVLWTGKPKQGLILSPRDVYLIPFSLTWCGFAVFWTVTSSKNDAPIFFTLWGSMFIAVGLYFVLGRFIHDIVNRSRIIYKVTRSGISIISGGTETIIPVGQWTCLEMTRYRDQTGTILFSPQLGLHSGNSFQIWVPSKSKSPQFYRIDDPARVLDLIKGMSQNASP